MLINTLTRLAICVWVHLGALGSQTDKDILLSTCMAEGVNGLKEREKFLWFSEKYLEGRKSKLSQFLCHLALV